MHLIAELESLDLTDARKLNNEPRLEQEGRRFAQDTANKVHLANTNRRKRSKASSGKQSSDTEIEVPLKEKARTKLPTLTNDAKQSVEKEPNIKVEASAPVLTPRTRKFTSRKLIKETLQEIPAAQDQVTFTEYL